MSRRVLAVLAVAAAAAVAGIGACAAFGSGDVGASDATGVEAGADVGAEGSSEGGGGCSARAIYCQKPPCMPEIFASTGAIGGLAVHGAWVYWTTGSAVMRQPAGGGNATQETLADQQRSAGPIVVGDDGVYWLTGDSGKVWTCPLTGPCAPRLVASGPVTVNERIGMALDSQSVYWAAYAPDAGGGVFVALKTGDGGAIPVSTEASAKYVVIDDANVYWHTNCQGASKRKKDDVSALPVKLGVTACTLGRGGLALSQSAVFIGGGNELARFPLVSGSLATLSGGGFAGLAVDCANDVYWTQPLDGGPALVRMPESAFHPDGTVDTGARETLVVGTSSVLVVAHSSGLYWASGTAILRLLANR